MSNFELTKYNGFFNNIKVIFSKLKNIRNLKLGLDFNSILWENYNLLKDTNNIKN